MGSLGRNASPREDRRPFIIADDGDRLVFKDLCCKAEDGDQQAAKFLTLCFSVCVWRDLYLDSQPRII